MSTVKKPTVYIMIGLPASGKSTYIKEHLGNLFCGSADDVRGELFGDSGLQYTDAFVRERGYNPETLSEPEKEFICNQAVWAEVYRRIDAALARGEDVVIDGINVTGKMRRYPLDHIGDRARFIGVWIHTDLDVCLKRSLMRSRFVGEDVIRRHAAAFEEPQLNEGFDAIEIRDQNGGLLERRVRPDQNEE